MNKIILCFTLIFGLVASHGVLAAPDLTGKTFIMKGKLKAVVSCAIAKESPITILFWRTLATITFEQGNRFTWVDDVLPESFPNAPTTVQGVWVQRRKNLIDLKWDEEPYFGVKAMSQFAPLDLLDIAPQNVIKFTTKITKYRFSAKTNAKGNKLVVMEEGDFKMNTIVSSGGVRDSCIVQARLKSTYKGRSAS